MPAQVDVKKLLAWAGFRFFPDDIGGLGGHGSDQYIREKRGWKYPNTYGYRDAPPSFLDDLNACFKWLVDPNPDIHSVKFVHYSEPNEEVLCYIGLRAPWPLFMGKWEASEMKTGGNKYAIALCRAIEQLNSAKERR